MSVSIKAATRPADPYNGVPPLRSLEIGKKEVDVVTIPNRDQTIVHA